jgi:hypothetical protein
MEGAAALPGLLPAGFGAGRVVGLGQGGLGHGSIACFDPMVSKKGICTGQVGVDGQRGGDGQAGGGSPVFSHGSRQAGRGECSILNLGFQAEPDGDTQADQLRQRLTKKQSLQ